MSPEGQAKAADVLLAILDAILKRVQAYQQRIEALRLAALEKARENQAKVQ